MPYVDHGKVTLADLDGRNFAMIWEASQILQVDQRTLAAALRRGEIPATKVGRTWRIPTTWLREQAAGTSRDGAA